MKKSITILFVFVVVMGFSMQADATLEYLGTDILDNRLIYDSDLDITWYDYTHYGATEWGDTWYNQISWAGALEVNFGDAISVDWRLPASFDPGCWGYGCTNNEMGHLYAELGNPPTGPLSYTGDFQDLQTANAYWTGTQYDLNNSMMYHMDYEYQYAAGKSIKYYGLAVHDGKLFVAVVPEPISSTLFLIGGATLGFRRFKKRAQ